MVPAKIHYCWFGHNPLPDEYKAYMESWKIYCPDYPITEWNETNFDVTENAYCREAYEAGKWAFVSDYARLKVIYEHGGIYLDTDVELLKPLEPLLGNGWIGFQNTEQAATGLGFGAEAHNRCVGEMLAVYEKIHFRKKEGSLNLTPCPVMNTAALRRCGLKTGRKNCMQIQRLDGIDVYPNAFFNPMDMDTMKLAVTEDAYSIHHYSASWITKRRKEIKRIKQLIPGCLLRYRTAVKAHKSVCDFEREMEKADDLEGDRG
ncbi:hypothetical protein D3Z50_14470 [Clostridiaceae bacterium]|nr:hypothetical protein [Clostridiaceae bacterium]